MRHEDWMDLLKAAIVMGGIVLIAFLTNGCVAPREPNPFDAYDSEWNFNSGTGRWEQTR